MEHGGHAVPEHLGGEELEAPLTRRDRYADNIGVFTIGDGRPDDLFRAPDSVRSGLLEPAQ